MRATRIYGRMIAAIVALISGVAFSPAIKASAYTVPFKDPNASGFIGLCDRAGNPMKSGSLQDVPFVWTAVSSTPAPPGYEHGKATLYAMQPRQHADPSQWWGRQITSSSSFTNPAHPMVQSTNVDSPLLWFVQAYPNQWAGLVQLRIYYSGINLPVEYSTYPSTVLRVNGNTWSVVSGGAVACNVGKATSAESQLLSPSQLAPRNVVFHDGPVTTTAGAGSTPSSDAPATANPSSFGSSPLKSADAAKSSSTGGGGFPTGAIVGIVLFVLATAGGASFWIRQRRIRPRI